MDIKFERLPVSKLETPVLYGSYDCYKDKVSWVIDSEDVYDMTSMGDGTNWYQVWREGNKVCLAATCWFESGGAYELKITDIPPKQAVQSMECCAESFMSKHGGW